MTFILNKFVGNIIDMKIKNVSVVYFSATYTTQKIIRKIAQAIKPSFQEYDITRKSIGENIYFDTDELLIVGVPVYAGRVPIKAVEELKYFKANDTPVILVAVYGNRAYEDALIELKDIVEKNFFKVVSLGAFIGQHSIFSPIALKRPNSQDLEAASEFARSSSAILSKIKSTESLNAITIPGNTPYKPHGQFPIFPHGNDELCNKCGKCAMLCPAKAINKADYTLTDGSRCWSCGRCIQICPKGARSFSGDLYAEKLEYFIDNFSTPKEPEFFLATHD